MIRISANLGFLWTSSELPDAIRSAACSDFDAVEFHMPYSTPVADVREALEVTGLPVMSLNTRIGEGDQLGVAALPGFEAQARDYIDEAVEYASAIDCAAISVVAGKSGRTFEAEETYRQNLTYAAEKAEPLGITVLIEPLNTTIDEDYHLVSCDAGAKTIAAVGLPNLKLMVDCFHVAKMDGDLKPVFERVLPVTGHIQFASIPERNEPDLGDVDYAELLPWLVEHGYDGAFGAEYVPVAGDVGAGLDWLQTIRKEIHESIDE